MPGEARKLITLAHENHPDAFQTIFPAVLKFRQRFNTVQQSIVVIKDQDVVGQIDRKSPLEKMRS